MPIYTYECEEGHHFDQYVPLTTSENPNCPLETCQKRSEKIWSCSGKSGGGAYPYITTHITGKPLEIKSPGHERQLLKQFNLRKRDDNGYSEYLGVDFKTGKQRYKEVSGAGLPGCWV